MRTNGRTQEILDRAQTAFQDARTGKLPYIRRGALIAEDTDRMLGTAFFQTIKEQTGLDSRSVRSPSTRAAKGHIGKLTEAFRQLIEDVATVRGNIPVTATVQVDLAANEDLPEWLRKGEARFQQRLG